MFRGHQPWANIGIRRQRHEAAMMAVCVARAPRCCPIRRRSTGHPRSADAPDLTGIFRNRLCMPHCIGLYPGILKTVRTTAQMASSLLQATGGYGVPVPLILHEEIEMQPVTDDREQGSSGGASEVSQSLRNSGFGAYRVCRPIFCICMRTCPHIYVRGM